MTVIRSLTFCGTLFSLLVILVALSSQLDFVLGQDESSSLSETTDSDGGGGSQGPTLILSTSVGSQQEENEVIDHGTDADEHCPCVQEKSCPRKYGTDPLDFTTFGHLESCSEEGFVRCCGVSVSVSVVQQTDETVGGGVPTASDIDEYDETATWDLGHAAEQQQEHVSEEDDTSSKDNSEVSSDNLHEIHQGQLNQDTEKEEREEEQSSSSISSSGDEESKKENDEHEQQQEEQIIDDNEDEDNVPAESNQSVQIVLMDEPAPSRKRFQPSTYKFPRYGGRPAETVQENVVPSYDSSSLSSPPPPMSSGGNEDSGSSIVNSGNNFRRKTFSSLRAQKVNPTPTSTPDNNDNGGSVVYSQRVSDISPYRSRNNVNRNNNNHNKASVVTSTTVDGGSGGDISEETVETTPISAEASSSLANGGNSPARQRYQQRKRRPFNQMRNRQQQQEEQVEITDSKSLVMDGDEIGAQIKPEQPIYGTSGSGQSSPAPLHVPVEQEESSVGGETLSAVVDEQLDNNRRRPMSRLVKPRVNGPNNHGRRRMKPAMSEENGDSSLYPNNSYGSAPTTDNGNEQQQKQEALSSSQEEESSGSLLDDSSAESKATIGSAAESEKNGGEIIQNSSTGKLMPVRPKIRPFNRKAPGWSATSNDNADGGDGNSQINDDESKEVDLSGHTSSSGDLIKQTEQEQQHQKPNNGAVNIRRVPMRRVQQQQQQQLENIPVENGGGGGGVGGNDGGNVEPEVPVVISPVVKGRIPMRRPINYPGKNNNDVPATAPVQQLSTSIETEAEPNVQPEQVVEKLDVRARLRGRIRPNPLKALSSVQALPIANQAESPEEEISNEKADANSGEVVSQLQPNEPSRSPLLRKRRPLNSRPSILAGQGQRKQQAEEESENNLNNVSAVDASPVTNNVEDHQSGERPRVNIIRKGGVLGRLPLQRNHNKPTQSPENTKEDDDAILDPAVKPTLPRIRQRQNRISSNNRGNSRLPLRGNGGGGSVDETSTSVAAEDANIATSEAPVTVTSTYSRIRTNNNNKNSMLTRPIYRRPSYATTPTPSIPADQYSSPQSSSTNAIGSSNRFGQRTRFTVPSKSESQATEQPTLSINSDNDNESEKQGQSSGQLNEQSTNSPSAQQTSFSEDTNTGGRKKVGFVRRKMVRGRPKQAVAEEQQQTEQQMLGENQEKKPEEAAAAVVYDQAGSNPGAPETIHVSIQEEAVGLNKQQEEQQQQTPSTLPGSEDSVDADDNDNSHNDHVKIVPVASAAGEDATTENTSHSEKEASGEDGKEGSIDEHDDDDDESDDTENSSEEADGGKYHHNNNAGGKSHHAGVSDLVDSDTYDLILNQDVRKTLGTQNSTQHHTQYEEPSSAYQSTHIPNTPATHLANRGGSGGAGNSNVRNNNYQHHQQQEDYYGSYYDTYNTNTHDVNDHKYSAGVSGGSSSSLASNHYNHGNKESSAADGIETLELGTPDYDPNPGVDSSQYYWQGYENLEDEEESRVHMKYLRNKSTPLSSSSPSSSPQSIESGEDAHSLSQNEGSNNYNGDNINGVGISQSPVNPQQQTPYSNAVPVQQSQLSSSTNTDADVDAKKDKNRRIRQKLRRPPSAYIGGSGSEDSSTNDHVRAPTSAPFTPSLQSPRPTYSGQEALIESVHQSVQTLPPKQENPNSQQLEQFIEQNNKNVAPSRNRSRVRVKLVTLKTTTPAPVVNTKYYDDDNENYSGTTSDATVSSSSTSNGRPSRLPSSKFKFPPFRKSELPLVDATAPVETEPVSSYNPQRVVFRPAASPSPTTTTTTTTTPAPRKPLRNYNYQNNDNVSNYNGINKAGSISSSLPGKGRFKVTSPSSTEPIKQTASPSSSYTSPAPVIKKTQPRIRAPQFPQRLPVRTTTTTTETPVVIRHQYQVTSTSAPSTYASNSENLPQQPEEPYHHTTSQLSEDDENIISIRITSQDDSSVIDNSLPPPTNENIEVEPQQYYQNVDTRTQQPQQQQQQQLYSYQQENIVKEKPQPLPLPPPPTPLISNDVTKYNGKKNSGGKYSGRFKVPEKFELQKPHLLPSSNNVDLPDVRKPYVKPALPAPVSLPAREEDRYQNQIQIEPESNGYNLYDNVDVAHHRPQQTISPQLGQLNNQVVLEEQRRPLPPPPIQQVEEQEIVPDIRINVASPDQHPDYNVDNNEHNYNSNNNNVFFNREPEPQQVIHAVREPQHEELSYQQQQQYYRPEHFERDNYRHNQALRNSPYGPFPSTDHWSGIPSSNSPRLPEHFEQKRLPAQQQRPSFEFQNEIRRPPISHEFEQQRPSRPVMLPHPQPQQPAPGNDIRFVDSDEEDNRVQYAPVPVNPTVIQFGTEFGPEEVEEEVISKPQRPALPFDHSGSHGLRENEGLAQQRPPISHPNRLQPLPPAPPQSYSHGIPPPNENLEYQQRPVGNQEIQFSNNHISPVRSQNEQPQQQLINIHRQPPAPVQVQEPLIHGIPPNSVIVPPPVNPISIEIKDGELVNAENGNEIPTNNIPHLPPQQQQHVIQLPPSQQQQQQQIIQLPPPQQQQQQHIIQLPLAPPKQLHPQQPIHHQNTNMPPPPPGMVIEQNFRPDQRLPIQNSQLPPEHNPNFIVQVDGRPLETNHALNQPPVQLLKPLDHHPEKEPEIKIVNHPVQLMPPQKPNHPNFPTLNPEGRPVIMPNIRDQQFLPNVGQQHPQARPQQVPLQHHQQQPPTQQGVPNFGETLMQQGFGEHHPSRPGQYGPPPPGQQRPSQYVPFNAPPKRNESQELSHQQRLPVLPPPPQTFQNPFKFNGGQNQPFPPPQHQQQQHHASRQPPPYRQNFNGNYMNPIPQNQQFSNHHQQRPQQPPMMRMPNGIPNGQLGNNPHFPPQQNHHLRPRNSGMRTSRAANLTAEEEKDEREASGTFDISKQAAEEQEEQSQTTLDQQEPAILQLPTPQNNIPSEAISQVAPNPDSDKRAEGMSSSTNVIELPKSVSEAQFGQQRQQRELLLKKEDAKRAGTVNSENFVQDEIPDESSNDEQAVERNASQDIPNSYQTIPSTPLVEPKKQSQVEDDEYDGNVGDNVDNLTRSKLEKQKKMQEQSGERQQKGKPEMEDGRLVLKSSESKKSIMKIKSIGGGKDKSEQLGKGTANKNGKEQQASDGKNAGDAEIQDFVAPKVIQRGFHPILPYSEQDPGPVVVQMLPKVEKFFPQPTMTTIGSESSGRAENGPQGVMMMGFGSFHQDPNQMRNSKHVSTGNLPVVAMVATNVLNAQPTVVVNNQAPFRSLLHNHLS